MELKRDTFIAATKELVETLTKVVEAGRKEFNQIGGFQFSLIVPNSPGAKGIRQIIEPTWNGYYKWLKTVGVGTRKEMEELWSSFGEDKDVLDCIEELHAAEAKYNELTAQADADVQREEDKAVLTDSITVGSTLPGELEVINIDSGEKETIGSVIANSPYTLFILVRHYA